MMFLFMVCGFLFGFCFVVADQHQILLRDPMTASCRKIHGDGGEFGCCHHIPVEQDRDLFPCDVERKLFHFFFSFPFDRIRIHAFKSNSAKLFQLGICFLILRIASASIAKYRLPDGVDFGTFMRNLRFR